MRTSSSLSKSSSSGSKIVSCAVCCLTLDEDDGVCVDDDDDDDDDGDDGDDGDTGGESNETGDCRPAFKARRSCDDDDDE